MVCLNDAHSSVWVTMRGVLVKCNRDRVRLATDSEWIGAELIKVLCKDAMTQVDRKGQRGFVDATGEEGPSPSDEEPEPTPSAQAAEAMGLEPLPTIPEDSELAESAADVPLARQVTQSSTAMPSASEASGEAGSPTPRSQAGDDAGSQGARDKRKSSEDSGAPAASQKVPRRRQSRSDLANDPNLDDMTLGDLKERVLPMELDSGSRITEPTPSSSSTATPSGGWIAAEDRQRSNNAFAENYNTELYFSFTPYPYEASTYLVQHEILPGSYAAFEDAAKQSRRDVSGDKLEARAEECCIALDDFSGKL